MPGRPRRDSISSIGKPSRRATTQFDAIRSERPPPGGVGGWLRGALVDNAALKLLSLILALTVYLLVNADETRNIKITVEIRPLYPPDKALVSEPVREVEVTIRGPIRRIKRWDDREIGRIDLDLTNVQSGEVPITPDLIPLPRGLEVVSINPSAIKVAFEDKITDTVDIEASIGGRPLHGYTIARDRVRIEPDNQVEVSGAVSVMRALSAVRTQEIRVDGEDTDVEANVKLVPPAGVELVQGEEVVTVIVPIERAVVVKKLTSVPIELRLPPGADPAKWAVSPMQVELEINGFQLDVEPSIAAGIVASVTVADTKGGQLEVKVEGLREGVGVKVSPAKVSVSPKR